MGLLQDLPEALRPDADRAGDEEHALRLVCNELTRNDFLARACAILRLGDEVERAYQILLNPQHNAEARDLLCTGAPDMRPGGRPTAIDQLKRP